MAIGTYENHIKATDRLYNESLYNYTSLGELHGCMKLICDEFDAEWKAENIFRINPQTFSKPHIIFGVSERISLTKIIEPNKDSSFEAKYHVPPLREYLLLTCIDQPGQQEGWSSFEQWVVSKRKAKERAEIVAKVSANGNIEFAAKLYQSYQELYGVRKSFFRFFDGLLKEDQQDTLFSQIKIEIYDCYPDDFTFQLGTRDELKKYLYSVRNNFTHSTRSTGPYPLLWPEHKDKEGWYEKEWIYGKITKKIKVKESYLIELETLIKKGIWEFIRKNATRK